MKIDIGEHRVQCGALIIESLDGLRSITIQGIDGIRCLRYSRPHPMATLRWDDEKRYYGSVSEALTENVKWLEGKE